MPPTQRRVGAYAKLLANYAYDDALIAAGEKAELLFVRGLAFCATSDSDGFITDAQVIRYVGAGMRDAAARAKALVREGVWQRVDGGYQVRSWTKIHETAEQKGRRLKADRERKKAEQIPTGTPDGIQAESEPESEPIPDGTMPDSLSMTRHDTTETRQHTTPQDELTSGGNVPETLQPAPESTPPEKPYDEERCSTHQGVANPPPCTGCKAARERTERRRDRDEERETERRRLELETARRDCPDCEGTGKVLDPDTKLPTTKRCTHPTTSRRTA